MYLLWENMLSSAMLRLSTVTLLILSHQILESCETHSLSSPPGYLAILSNKISCNPHAKRQEDRIYSIALSNQQYPILNAAEFMLFEMLFLDHTYGTLHISFALTPQRLAQQPCFPVRCMCIAGISTYKKRYKV